MSTASNITKQVMSELESMQGHLSTFKSNAAYLNDAKAQVEVAVEALKKEEKLLSERIAELQATFKSVSDLQNATYNLVHHIDGIDFPDRLHQIEETVKDTIHEIEKTRKATVRELEVLTRQVAQVDFKGNFERLKGLIESSSKVNAKIADTIQKQDLPGRLNSLQENVDTIMNYGIDAIRGSVDVGTETTIRTIKDVNFPIRMDKLDASVAGLQAGIMNLIDKTDRLERELRNQIQNESKELRRALDEILKQQNEDRRISEAFQKKVLICLVVIIFGGVVGFLALWLR